VVSETLALNEFCERVGLENTQDMSALTQELEKKPPLYSEREAEGKSEEELKTLYSQFVPSQELLALIALIELFDPVIATQLRTLLELPQTYEDYLIKVSLRLMLLSNSRMEILQGNKKLKLLIFQNS
jgi:hypothetical protein